MADEPCEPWATVDEISGANRCQLEAIGTAELEEALTVASAWLYRLSGRQYPGACEVTVRPIAECRGPHGPVVGWVLYSSRGGTYELLGPAGLADPSIGRDREGVPEVPLGYSPLREIVEVLIDGQIFPSADYRIDDDYWLVRTDGYNWPTSNDMRLPSTEEGTWEVTFIAGADPPADGAAAARTLAIELARAATGNDCALPARTTSLARQGVTLTLMDPTGMLERGRFGIFEVDAFLQTTNPHNLTEPAIIVNVDLMRRVRRAPAPFGS